MDRPRGLADDYVTTNLNLQSTNTSRYRDTTNYDLASSPGSRRRGSPGRRVLISTSKRDAMLTNSFSQSRSITYLEPLRVQIQTTRSSSEISPVQPGLLQLEKNYTIRAQKRRKNKKDYVDEFIFPISFRLRALELDPVLRALKTSYPISYILYPNVEAVHYISRITTVYLRISVQMARNPHRFG